MHFALQYLKMTHWRIKVLGLVGSYCLTFTLLYINGEFLIKKITMSSDIPRKKEGTDRSV